MKKHWKKLIAFLTAVIILAVMVPFLGLASAKETEPGVTLNSPLSVEVTTGKSKYTLLSVIEFNVRITNNSDTDIENIDIVAQLGQDLVFVKGSEITTSKNSLAPGEVYEWSYKAKVNRNCMKGADKLLVPLAFMRDIFVGDYSDNNQDSNFGSQVCENGTRANLISAYSNSYLSDSTISVFYDETATDKSEFTEKELDEMEEAETKISELLNSIDYQTGDENYRKTAVQGLLQELADSNLIISNSVIYNEEYKQFYFLYNSGVEHYICIEEKIDSTLLPKQNQDFLQTLQNEYEGASQGVSIKSKNSINYNTNNAIFTYGAEGTYEPISNIDTLNRLGLKTNYITYPTVEDYKTILSGYDMVIICEHGAEFFNKNKVGLSLAEKATRDKNKQYERDLKEDRITKFNNTYCILPDFFEHYYNEKLDNSFVQLISCQSFGRKGTLNYRFNESFVSCGALGTLGFHNSIIGEYGCEFSRYFTMAMFLGTNTRDAFNYACDRVGKDEYEYINKNLDRCSEELIEEKKKEKEKGIIAYPDITDYYSNPFDFGTFSITIKDKETGIAINEAKATIYWIDNEAELDKNNSNEHFEYKFSSNGGVLSGTLPTGYYKCEVIADGYQSEILAIQITKDQTTIKEPIYLIPVGNVTGVVKDKVTGSPISDVTLEVIDNSAGDFTTVATTTTNENGGFSLNLPAGSYSVSFNHPDYVYHGISLTVEKDATTVIMEPVYLTPKNAESSDIPSTAVEFNGHYYQVYDTPMTWDEAKAYCESLGGHLATITSAEEQELIANYAKESGQIPYYYLGGYKQNNNWNWVTGEKFEYTSWAIGEPNGSGKYMQIYNNLRYSDKQYGVWDDTTSTNRNKDIGFICEWDFPVSEGTNPVEFNGHYYQVYDTPMTWDEAKAYCEGLGGHLATITSAEESNFIKDLISTGTKNVYWLGASDAEQEGVWKWITGEPFEFTNWGSGEPNDNGVIGDIYPEDYLEMDRLSGEWNDGEIDGDRNSYGYSLANHGFICEWDNVNDVSSETGACITELECIDYGWYTGNMCDSCLFSLDKNGIYNNNADNHGFYRNGNIGLDGTEYHSGFEAWIARCSYKDEISWTYATYRLDGKYTRLTGKTSLIKGSVNTSNFNTSVYFYDGDTLLQSYTLTNEDYEKQIDVDVSGVNELKILVKDNKAVKHGTSFALYNMFLK